MINREEPFEYPPPMQTGKCKPGQFLLQISGRE